MRYEWWTTEEENLLKELTGKMSFQQMSETHFPKRTALGLQGKSHQMGLKGGFDHFLYTHDRNFWSIPNLMNSYCAGFTNADGNLQKDYFKFTIHLHEKDRGLLENFKDLFQYTGPIRTYNGYPGLVIHGCKEWYKDLNDIWSITPQKTFTVQPPKITDDNLIKAFLVGLYDGDGSIIALPKPTNRIRISLDGASLDMMIWVRDQLERLFPFYDKIRGISPQPLRVYKEYRANSYTLKINGLRALRIVNYLRQIPVPHLFRKWDKPEVIALIEKDKLKYPHLFQ